MARGGSPQERVLLPLLVHRRGRRRGQRVERRTAYEHRTVLGKAGGKAFGEHHHRRRQQITAGEEGPATVHAAPDLVRNHRDAALGGGGGDGAGGVRIEVAPTRVVLLCLEHDRNTATSARVVRGKGCSHLRCRGVGLDVGRFKINQRAGLRMCAENCSRRECRAEAISVK
eukprot:6201080-Pleurochrysis_carterae.AAC.1